MSTLQVSRLESLILEKICSLEYVSKVGYSDNGQEVTILVIHDDDRKRDLEILCEIGEKGRGIEDEMPDRMISPLAIQDGYDLPEGILFGRQGHLRKGGRAMMAPTLNWCMEQSKYNEKFYERLQEAWPRYAHD